MRRTAHHVSESVHEGVFVLYPKMVRGFLNLMAWLPEPGNQNRTTKRPRRQESVLRVTATSSVSLAQAGAEALTLNSIHTARCNEAGMCYCCAHRPHRSYYSGKQYLRKAPHPGSKLQPHTAFHLHHSVAEVFCNDFVRFQKMGFSKKIGRPSVRRRVA